MQDLNQYISRIRQHDTSLWSGDVAVQEHMAQRLGWTTLPEEAPELYPLLDRLAQQADERDISDVVLIGMGGSSLAPSVFAQMYSGEAKHPLHVLDTTCPEEVISLAQKLDFERTLFIVASKSGTTLETVTLEELYWDWARSEIADENACASHFVAITDANTPLAVRAQKRGYTLITSPSDVGGRFSAFSVFGLVPAALIGLDYRAIIDEALRAQQACERESDSNPAVQLASQLWHHLQAGDDKLPLPAEQLSMWLEQLIAESLGKEGKGIIPFTDPCTCCCNGHIMPCPDSLRAVEDSPLARYGGLRSCCLQGDSCDSAVQPVSVPYSMVVWEWATVLLAALMGVNPFDQPNVACAKEAVVQALKHPDFNQLDESQRRVSVPIDELLAHAQPNDYVCILAYVDTEEYEYLKEHYISYLAKKTKLPISLVQGPRYLHSIGQLHEGGPNTGIFIMVDNVSDDIADVDLPDRDYTLRAFFDAQRTGDVMALRLRGRRVTALNIGDLKSELSAL